jgi:Kef-type K+ transport system membrane component KefB
MAYPIGRPLFAAAEELLPLLFMLAVLVAAAKVVGSLSLRLGQPAVLGELLAGLILGPSLLDLASLPFLRTSDPTATIHLLGQLGVILLMFAAGLEVDIGDLRRAGRPAALAGFFGVLLPLGLGAAAASAFGHAAPAAVFAGIVLGATSVSISAQTLLELGRLREREGIALLGAAVVDDVLVIAVMTLFLALAAGPDQGLGPVGLTLLRMAAVLILVTFLSLRLLPRLVEWANRLRASQGLLALAVAGVMLLAWLTEFAGGVAAITGAFLAGLGLSRSHLREEIERGASRLGYGFFVPIFLVDIGLQSDLRDMPADQWLFAGVIVLVAVVSKVAGAGLGGWLGGLAPGSAGRLGLGMISRGEVGLIVAGVGIDAGLLAPELFRVVVLMVLTTTLITPPLLRWAFARREARNAAHGEPGPA